MGKDSERGKYTSPEGSRTWEYISAIFCASGMFCLGHIGGWNSPSVAELSAPNSRIPVTPGDASTMAACLSLGHAVGLPLSVFIVDRIGRRNSILMSSVPMMVSWVMILVAESAMVLIIARTMAGLGMSVIVCTAPIYSAEVLSTNIRGSLGATGIITYYLGVFFMFGVAPYLGLRITACCCMIFTMIFAICFWFIPESPYFLVMVGRVDDAESTLEKLRGKTDVADELELIKTTIREKGKSLVQSDKTKEGVSPKGQSAFSQLFTMRGNLKAFFIGMTASTLQHFCGFHMILYYCHTIVQDMGSQLDVYVASLIFSILQIFSAALTVLTVDRFGRRPLILISGIITSFLLFIIATYFYLMDHTDIEVKQFSIIPLGSIFLLVMVLNAGVITVPATIQAEIYSTDVKMLANCIVGIAGSVMTIFNTKFYLLLAKSWGFGHSIPFFGLAAITFLCTVILMRWLPETKGKTLLEIQRELNR